MRSALFVPVRGEEIKRALNNAASFLRSKQREDGGWGESFESCIIKQYVHHEKSQVINTSWALLSLMAMKYSAKSVIEKGIKLIKARQLPNGDFNQEGISGVFNHNCAITYTSYRNVFPLWKCNIAINYARAVMQHKL